jgi:hypothetical protein
MSVRAREIMEQFGHRQSNDRWMVEVIYKDGKPPLIFTVGELEDMDERIELGPDWHTIEQIVITLNRPVPSWQPRPGIGLPV